MNFYNLLKENNKIYSWGIDENNTGLLGINKDKKIPNPKLIESINNKKYSL